MKHQYTPNYIIEHAVALSCDSDYQVAQNIAYEDAINDGYTDSEAEEIALEAGSRHYRYE